MTLYLRFSSLVCTWTTKTKNGNVQAFVLVFVFIPTLLFSLPVLLTPSHPLFIHFFKIRAVADLRPYMAYYTAGP